MSIPEGWQDTAIETGMIVELHSLSRAELNGRIGECGAWDATKERWSVQLLGGSDRMAVRPVNLWRAAPAAPEDAEKAFQACAEGSDLLAAIRQGQGPPAQLFSQAQDLFQVAAELDPASTNLHQARGDMAHMRRDYHDQVKHSRRAVANGHNLTGADGCNHQNERRMALAAALGNAGDLEGELTQVRKVLGLEPGHVHARLTLGQSLLDRGDFESAVPELMMACQLPAESKPPWPSPQPEQHEMLRSAARDALCNALGRRAQQLAANGEHRKAADMLAHRLLAVPGISDEMAARTEANLATSLCALGETSRAEETLEKARARTGAGAVCRAHVLTTSGHCKEMLADAWRGGHAEVDETAAALYLAARGYFKEANALCEDASSRRGYTRVHAKTSQHFEWVAAPTTGARSLDGVLAGAARAITDGAKLEELPRGPSPGR
tara:strand:+ start:156 stop:1472 length:1317 start_codon:yes stop_codon:yes gene_type:complete